MGYLEQRRKTVTLLSTWLRAAQQQRLHRSWQQFVGLTAKLDAMSPLKVLSRLTPWPPRPTDPGALGQPGGPRGPAIHHAA